MEKLKEKINALDCDEEVTVSLAEVELLLNMLDTMLEIYEKYDSIDYMELMFAKEEMIASETTSYEIYSDVLIEALREIEDNT